MNPIYKFELTINSGDAQQVFPIYKDDITLDFEQESNQEFFRRKMSGKLTFVRQDYMLISSATFDSQFTIEVFISYDAGQSWQSYWIGEFWKTDCTFNDDDQTVVVNPSVKDDYTDILAGLDKEYNLIDLAPVINEVSIDKRMMIQIYVPGETTVGCFLSGMWWEQECEAVDDMVTLIWSYRFNALKVRGIIYTSGDFSPALPSFFAIDEASFTDTNTFEVTKDGYKLRNYKAAETPESDEIWVFEISNASTDVVLWGGARRNISANYSVTLTPIDGTGATGNVVLDVSMLFVMGRIVCDVDAIGSVETYPIDENVPVFDNRNYTRVVGYPYRDTIIFSDVLTPTPTKWGIYQPGLYYVSPESVYSPGEVFPISRNSWGPISMWFKFSAMDWLNEQNARKEYILKDSFPLWSVISVLLKQIAPNITHQATTAYSQFLYGQNPLVAINQTVLITPKSNLISSGYDQPAQKAIIKLRDVLDMLRDCFRCYWFVDEQKRFRIEHIYYFMNGGSYTGTPVIGRDLTQEIETRNGKPLSFGTSEYQFDKPNMAARYQFGWMDNETQLFDGFPINIISKYVNAENIEQIDISKFSADVDYILLNPGDISQDGFVLLCAVNQNGKLKLPYYNFSFNSTDHIVQNAYAAFMFLQTFYFWDMPARRFEINGVEMYAYGIKKLKTQNIKFPVLTDPDIFNLIKTGLGNGTIQKMSVNLSSRNANTTLKYDTE